MNCRYDERLPLSPLAPHASEQPKGLSVTVTSDPQLTLGGDPPEALPPLPVPATDTTLPPAELPPKVMPPVVPVAPPWLEELPPATAPLPPPPDAMAEPPLAPEPELGAEPAVVVVRAPLPSPPHAEASPSAKAPLATKLEKLALALRRFTKSTALRTAGQ